MDEFHFEYTLEVDEFYKFHEYILLPSDYNYRIKNYSKIIVILNFSIYTILITLFIFYILIILIMNCKINK